MVIYADVLYVLNFFITYLLLLLTGLFNRKAKKAWRLAAASCLGGAYSLVIFAPKLNFLVSFLGKLAVSLLLVIIAFGIVSVKQLAKNLAVFYFSNLLLLGIITGLWMLARPQGVAVKNNTVYFDIPAFAMLAAGLCAYVIALVTVKIHNSSISKNEIYSLTIDYLGKSVHLYAFADSGNKLVEPFSGYPVIVADSDKLPFEANRIIPYSTVGGEGALKAFKPDRVTISLGKEKIVTNKIYVAKSDVKGKEYSAILNTDILKL